MLSLKGRKLPTGVCKLRACKLRVAESSEIALLGFHSALYCYQTYCVPGITLYSYRCGLLLYIHVHLTTLNSIAVAHI